MNAGRRRNPLALAPAMASIAFMLAAGVAAAQESHRFVYDAEYANQPALASIRADAAYLRGITGEGVRLGLIDTGVNPAHLEFNGAIVWAYDAVTGQSGAGDFTHFIRNYGEEGHGSHVASIMAARRDHADRPLNMHGVAYEAALVVGAWDYTDTYAGMDARWSAALDQVSSQGVTAINNSWVGFYVKDIDPAEVTQAFVSLFPDTVGAIKNALHRGTVMVFGAGNMRDPHPTAPAVMPSYMPELAEPGSWIAVVATKKNGLDANGNPDMAFYSNLCGVARSYCIAAPGGNVARGRDPEGINGVDAASTDGYIYDSGTSMATPMVTGALGLVAQQFPWMDARGLVTTVLTTATHAEHPSPVWGRGLLALDRALRGPGLFELDFRAQVPGGHASTFANDISGPAGLIKEGEGTLALTGRNLYTGDTLVRQGSLALDGSAIRSRFYVDTQARLTGRGTAGPTTVAGVIAPGPSAVPFRVAGDFQQLAGSAYQVDIEPDGRSDQLQVARAAVIHPGATVQVSPLIGGGYQASYQILTAEQGISGSYQLIPTGYLFLDERLATTTTGIEMQLRYELGRNGRPIAAYAQSGNQRAVATAIDHMGQGDVIHGNMVTLTDAASVSRALGSLNGELYASSLSVLTEHDYTLSRTADSRLRVSGPARGSQAWAKLTGSWADWDGTALAQAVSSDMQTLLIGADAPFVEGFRAGLAAGASTGGARHDMARSDIDGYHILGYVGNQASRFGMRAGLGYSWYGQDVVRESAFGLPALKGRATSQSTQVFAEIDTDFDVNGATLRPFVAASHIRTRADRLNESLSHPAGLSVSPSRFNTTFATAGLRASQAWESASSAIRLDGMLGWRHAMGDLAPVRGMQFSTGGSFEVAGLSISRDMLILETGLSAKLGKSSEVGIRYGGQFSNRYKTHAAQASVRIEF